MVEAVRNTGTVRIPVQQTSRTDTRKILPDRTIRLPDDGTGFQRDVGKPRSTPPSAPAAEPLTGTAGQRVVTTFARV